MTTLIAVISIMLATINPTPVQVQTVTAVYHDYLVVTIDGDDYLIDDSETSPYLDSQDKAIFTDGEYVQVSYIQTDNDKVIQAVNTISDYINMNQVVDYEATDSGLLLHTTDGNGYYWER